MDRRNIRTSLFEGIAKLKEALEARRAKRKNLRDKVSKEKHENISKKFADKAGNKVNVDTNEAQARNMA